MANPRKKQDPAHSIGLESRRQPQTQDGQPVAQQQSSLPQARKQTHDHNQVTAPKPTRPRIPPPVPRVTVEHVQEHQEVKKKAHSRDQSWDAQR